MKTQDSSQEFIADSISQAMRQVKAVFGPDAIILSQNIIGNKVRLVALPSTAIMPQAVNSQIESFVLPDVVQKPLAKQVPLVSLLSEEPVDEALMLQDDVFSATYLRNTNNKAQSNVSEDVSNYIKSELASIKELIKEKQPVVDNAQTEVDSFNVHQLTIMRSLHKAKLVCPIINQFVASLAVDLSLEESWEFVINKIIDAMIFDKAQCHHKRIKTFIGPSGAGKSLLLAKLLIYFANKPLNNNFAIIFVNNNNLKVLEESKVYGRLFGAPSFYAESFEELEDVFAQCADKEHVFIDFPAYDFNQPENNYFINFLQKHREDIDNTLVVSSHCQYSYIERIFNAFQKTLIDGVSITKLDENNACTDVINFLLSYNVPLRNLSFGSLNFTNGFSSRLMFADKHYFQEYFTRILPTNKS